MRVEIEKLVYGGAGMARTNEGIVFVPKTASGDVVEIDLIEKKKDYARGRIRQIVTPSPDRRAPVCPNYNTAGCCHWDHIRYERQLDYKDAILRESLKRLAKIDWVDAIPRIIGPERGYRLRATFHLRDGIFGFVRENSNVVVPINECAALAPELNEFIAAASEKRIPAVSVDAVASDEGIAAAFHFPGGHTQRPWERWRDALFEIPGLASLTFTAESQRVRYEKSKLHLSVSGTRYALDSEAFFQANRFLLEAFVNEVIEQAGPSPTNVLDLFSGSGFFSIALAKRSRQVIGIESNAFAVKQAKANATTNGVSNAEFAAGKVEDLLANADLQPDVVILNPPRSGAGTRVVSQIAGLNASRIVYVSCNPTTFAREAADLGKNGYRLDRITMIDQFPNTYHIEVVALALRG